MDKIVKLILEDEELKVLLKEVFLWRSLLYETSCTEAVRRLAAKINEKYGIDIEVHT